MPHKPVTPASPPPVTRPLAPTQPSPPTQTTASSSGRGNLSTLSELREVFGRGNKDSHVRLSSTDLNLSHSPEFEPPPFGLGLEDGRPLSSQSSRQSEASTQTPVGQPDPRTPETHSAYSPRISTYQTDSLDENEDMYASPSPPPQSSDIEEDLPTPDIEQDVLDRVANFTPQFDETGPQQAEGIQDHAVDDEGMGMGLSPQPPDEELELSLEDDDNDDSEIEELLFNDNEHTDDDDANAMDCENESNNTQHISGLGRPSEPVTESTVTIKEEDIEGGGFVTQTISLAAKKEALLENATRLQLYDAEEDQRREEILLAELEELRSRRANRMDELREGDSTVGLSSRQTTIKRELMPLSVYFIPGEVVYLSFNTDSNDG